MLEPGDVVPVTCSFLFTSCQEDSTGFSEVQRKSLEWVDGSQENAIYSPVRPQRKAPSQARANTCTVAVVSNLDKVSTPFVASQRGYFQRNKGKDNRLRRDVF